MDSISSRTDSPGRDSPLHPMPSRSRRSQGMIASSSSVRALDPRTELAIGKPPLGKINEELTESSGEEDGSGNKMHSAVKSDFI